MLPLESDVVRGILVESPWTIVGSASIVRDGSASVQYRPGRARNLRSRLNSFRS